MSNPFIGEIRIFANNYAPTGWAKCQGQLLSISQNTALFSILGTVYGGNGQSNFALPDFQGRAPMHWGTGNGLSARSLGDISGSETVILNSNEIPAHTHLPAGKTAGLGNVNDPNTKIWGHPNTRPASNFYTNTGNNVPMDITGIGNAGGDQPHNNLMPYLILNFCIALQGVFPQNS